MLLFKCVHFLSSAAFPAIAPFRFEWKPIQYIECYLLIAFDVIRESGQYFDLWTSCLIFFCCCFDFENILKIFWWYFESNFIKTRIDNKNGFIQKMDSSLVFMTILCKSFQHFQGYLITLKGISRLVLWIFMQCNEKNQSVASFILWSSEGWWRGIWMFQEKNQNSTLIILLPANIVQYIVG